MSTTVFLALVGPTCIGKTRYAHEIISEFPLELVSVDSFQVYRFFRMGTGRADLHTNCAHLYGFWDPQEMLSPERYLSFVSETLDEISSNGNYPLFEGGSISYIRALLQRYTLKIIGLKPRDSDHALELIDQRITATSEELLISEIAEGLRRGYRDTIIMRDDVVYLPYVEYLTGSISLEDVHRRVRKNLVRRYQSQMEEYNSLPVEWFIPSDHSLTEIRGVIDHFLAAQARESG